jgi:type VI secretion system VgrG family protein
MASEKHVELKFESKALGAETFSVLRFSGEEAISQLYRFEIDLVSEEPDIDQDAVLGQPATLTIQRGDDGTPRKVHGILAEFEQGQEGRFGHYRYRAVLVPRLWLLSLSRQNQIYQNKSVVDIVEEELMGAQDKGPAELAAIGLTGQDFEFRVTGSYPVREYVVQYQETDLDFVSRLLEHNGIFYYFEQGDTHEKIVFCDDNVGFPAVVPDSKIPYNPASGTSSAGEDGYEESVGSLNRAQRQITGRMIVKDYNYRTPTTPLQGEADIDDLGHGLISEYGNHFKNPEEGQALAKVRAQEILCRKVEFVGKADRMAFAAGTPFTLKGHYNSGFDQDYVLTRVTHSGTQAYAEATGFPEVDANDSDYRNEFTAIPFQVPFRPARLAPKPKLHGVMNGHIDSAGPGTRAEIDSEGRYKLVMPIDLSGTAGGKATRWVRMAQPYGGGQQGMHFPLHKGTEVIWTCIGGDPDRPIITGVVPNPLNKSVINAESHTKNRIQTASGILIEIEDGPGAHGETSQQGDQQQKQRLEPVAQVAQPATAAEPSNLHVETARQEPASALANQQQQQAASNGNGQEAAQGRYLRMHVPQAALDSAKNNPPQTIDPQDPHFTYYGAQPDSHPGDQELPNGKIEAYMRIGANVPRTDGSVLKAGEDSAWLPLQAEPGDALYGYPALEKTVTNSKTNQPEKQQTQAREDGLFDGFIDNISDGNDVNGGNPSRTDEVSKAKFRNGVVWRDHVSGNRLSTTLGDSVEIISGNYRQVICNGAISTDAVNGVLRSGSNVPGNVSMKWIEIGESKGLTADTRLAATDADSPKQWGVTEITRNGWTKSDYEGYTEERTVGDTFSHYVGYQESHTQGHEFSTFLGTRTEVAGGLDLSYWAGLTGSVHQGIVVEIESDWKYQFNHTGDFQHVAGNSYIVSQEQDLIAKKSIMLQINPAGYNAAWQWFKGLTVGGQFVRAVPVIGPLVGRALKPLMDRVVITRTMPNMTTFEMDSDKINLELNSMVSIVLDQASNSIEMKAGPSSIKLDSSGISIKGPQVKLNPPGA